MRERYIGSIEQQKYQNRYVRFSDIAHVLVFDIILYVRIYVDESFVRYFYFVYHSIKIVRRGEASEQERQNTYHAPGT